jgi:hypothetical protein
MLNGPLKILNKIMNTCETCKFWREINSDAQEHMCIRSKYASMGVYGQDGKAVITTKDFGCIFWNVELKSKFEGISKS